MSSVRKIKTLRYAQAKIIMRHGSAMRRAGWEKHQAVVFVEGKLLSVKQLKDNYKLFDSQAKNKSIQLADHFDYYDGEKVTVNWVPSLYDKEAIDWIYADPARESYLIKQNKITKAKRLAKATKEAKKSKPAKPAKEQKADEKAKKKKAEPADKKPPAKAKEEPNPKAKPATKPKKEPKK